MAGAAEWLCWLENCAENCGESLITCGAYPLWCVSTVVAFRLDTSIRVVVLSPRLLSRLFGKWACFLLSLRCFAVPLATREVPQNRPSLSNSTGIKKRLYQKKSFIINKLGQHSSVGRALDL